MGLIDKVRVADQIGDQMGDQAPLTSPEGNFSGTNQKDATRLLRFQEQVDQAKYNGELQQSEGSGKGVLYCELNIENGFPGKSIDSEGEKNIVDPSIPYTITTEDP